MEQVTLYFRQGSADKVYQASIEQQNGGYLVAYAFGRRGTTLQTGTKTQSPVSYEEAKRVEIDSSKAATTRVKNSPRS